MVHRPDSSGKLQSFMEHIDFPHTFFKECVGMELYFCNSEEWCVQKPSEFSVIMKKSV